MSAVQPWRPRSAESALRGRQGCRGYGDSHGYGYGMGMGTVMNPHGPVGTGNSVGIFDWVEIKRKCVKYAINVIVDV